MSKSMDWFLYDNGLRLERVKLKIYENKKITCSGVFFYFLPVGFQIMISKNFLFTALNLTMRFIQLLLIYKLQIQKS